MYLLDTNAISETVKPRADRDFMRWFDATSFELMMTSCLVIGEIVKGVNLSASSARQKQLKSWLSGLLENTDQVLDIDLATTQIWGQLAAQAQRSGQTLPAIDALIAAQCLRHNLTLVTRNVQDFNKIAGLKLLSPWRR